MGVRPRSTAVPADVPIWQLGTKRARAETVIIFAAFALYAAFLLKLLLFSRAPGSEGSINLVPFASIAKYAFGHSHGTGRVAFANIVGNVLIFVPLGVYASWLRHRAAAWVTMLTVASVSIAVEIIQGVFGVGATDIDDVVLNCVGGLIGILTFGLLSAIMRERFRVRSALAVLSLLTMPVWCYLLFLIRLHL